jgi:hypothetical protein
MGGGLLLDLRSTKRRERDSRSVVCKACRAPGTELDTRPAVTIRPSRSTGDVRIETYWSIQHGSDDVKTGHVGFGHSMKPPLTWARIWAISTMQ